jgi:hypothetical protein
LPLIQPDGALTIVVQAEGGMYAVRSTDGGGTFAVAARIAPLAEAAQPLLRAPPLPAAAVDASGRLLVAWADCAFRQGCDGNTIVLTTSTDGVTWSALKRVPGTGFDGLLPGIAADPSVPGRISIVMYVRTRSACSAATCSLGVAVVSSRDGGATVDEATAAGRRVGPLLLACQRRRTVRRRLRRRFVLGGRFVPVFALASRPTAAGTLREYMMAASMS